MLRISMGNSNFREIRTEGYYYVDKSLMIRELILDPAKVVLLPRPRRFGKTLNLNMCEAFFSDQEPQPELFEGLAIADDPASMKHFGRYPTIGLTFKDLHANTWESCQIKLKSLVSNLFQAHERHIQPSPAQQRLVDALIAMTAPIELVEQALQLLTQLLHGQRGQAVVILIDEYDTPIQDGYFYGYYDKIVAFMRGFLGSALKDNPFLRKGILTGILRIAQESLFSGLNNIQVHTVTDTQYASCFGFTDDEVKKLLTDSGQAEREQEVKDWYNGYQFGNQVIYNPWSLLSVAMRPGESLRGYWVNTSQDKLIETLITEERCITLEELAALLQGQTLVKEVRDSVALSRIDGQSIWSLLLFSGYLTFTERLSESQYRLKLPNREVGGFFENIVRRWLEGPESPHDPLQAMLAKGDLAAFKAFLEDRVMHLVGAADTGGRSAPENFFHGLVLGLVANKLDLLYEITSNRDAGLGRYDLQLRPRNADLPGYIFEFKRLAKDSDQHLDQAAGQALAQIKAQGYAREMTTSGLRSIWLVGLAFRGKRLAMVWEPTGPGS